MPDFRCGLFYSVSLDRNTESNPCVGFLFRKLKFYFDSFLTEKRRRVANLLRVAVFRIQLLYVVLPWCVLLLRQPTPQLSQEFL